MVKNVYFEIMIREEVKKPRLFDVFFSLQKQEDVWRGGWKMLKTHENAAYAPDLNLYQKKVT